MTVDCLSVNMEEHVEKHAEEVASLPKISRTILDNFGLLTKNQPQQRKKGGVSLAKHLQTCIGNASENGQNEVKYALVRIIRGLGAPKIVARAGFFSTFMVILTKIVQTNHVEFVKEIFELIKKHLSTGKSNSKSENADISAGRILAYGALLRSRIFFSASSEQQQEILNGILTAGQKRFYLVLLSYEFIIELFDSMEESQFKKLVLPAIKPEICKPFIDQSLDSLYLLFKCKEKYPNVFTEKFLNKNVGSSTIINEKNVKTIADVILIKPSLSTKHPLINVATKAIAESDCDCLIAFFEHMDFLQMKPVYSRHVLVSHLSKLIIEQFKEEDGEKKAKIPDLLMPTFIKHTLTYFKEKPSKKDELHQKLHQLFDTIINSIKSQGINSETKLALIRKLLFEPGTFNFEQITKLKVIQQVSSSLDSEGVKELIKIYFEVITDENNRCDTFQNMDRLYAAQMLARLLGHPSLQQFEEYKTSQMEFLMDISLLETNKYCNVGAELAGHLKSTFYRALDVKVSKLESYKSLFSTLLNHAKEIINKPLRVKLTEEDKQTFNKALEIVEKLELDLKEGSKTKKSKKDLYLVFQVLFMHLSMQIFNDPNMANEAIEELFNCYERVNDSNKKKKNKNAKENSDLESDIEWIEVVTDLFLNLLSHNSHLLRSLVNYVFPYMCQHVTLNSLHQVLSVLDPENSSILQKKRKKYGEEDDDDENSSDEDDENNDENEKSDEDEDEEDEDEDDDGDEDDFDADETVNDKLRQALREALGTNGYQTDEESVDIDNLSDTEAEKLDKALGKAFKQFKPNLGRRNKQSKSDEALTHFRLRSLDLIEIYIENNPSMSFCLEMILPLLKALEFTVKEKHQQPLQDRIKSIIAKLTGIKKFSSSSENSQGEVDEKCLTNFLSKIVDQEERESPSIVQEIGESISDANKFILKCSTQNQFENNKKLKKQLIKKYLEFIDEFFNSRDCLIPYVLLKDLCLSMWTGNFKLLPKLCEICFNTEIKLFKRNQGLNLLKILLTNNRLFNTLSKEKKNEENVNNVNAEEVGVGVSETLTQLFNASSDFLQSLIKDNSNQTNEKYISTLFQILKALKHVSSLPVFKSTMDEAMNWQELGELIRNYRSQTKLSKDAITSFKALCKAIGISHVVKINAKAMKSISSKEGEGEDDEEEEGSNKAIMSKEKAEQKRKNRLETLKQKKQARLERLKASSEGLQGISFSKANLEEVKDEYKQEKMDVDDDLNEAAGSEDEEEEERERERKTKKESSGKKLNNKKNKRKNSASPQEVEVKEEDEQEKVVEEPKKKKKKKTAKV